MYYNLNKKFNDVVKKFSNYTALKYENAEYSYSELNSKANQYVRYLKYLGFKRGDVLSIINTKEFDSYVIMISCLKLGVAYVNIDSLNPIIRIKQILNRCQSKGVFESGENEKFKNLSEELHLNHIKGSEANHYDDKAIFEEEFDGNTIAYIMFTSGSTGEPKGVAVTHQNLLHFSYWIKEKYSITHLDNFANLSPMYFDNSVFDFYGALFNGATLTPIQKKNLDNPKFLVNYVDKMKCTIWFSVPSLLIFLINMKVLNKNILSNIKVFTFGGEGFPKSILKKLFDTYSDNADIINVYGPTEGTCICSTHNITENDFEDMSKLPSLGQMNPNFSYFIDLDNSSKQGELVIIGPNIAAGYYNDMERSEKVFGVMQEGKYYLNRYYKTGDLVSEKKGLLYFHGRKDNQIKHMGYRIEIEEIENAINSLGFINESAVIYKRINDSYGKIISFLVSEIEIDEKQIKEKLSSLIPHYMTPSKILFLDSIPKNANGKIDRKALLNY
jgi:D-alanine--poly(phosphoribitol) ligase subunit 1